MNNLRVDLHIHSTASDGQWSAQQLIDQIVATGIDLFSVTDHDTTRNVKEAGELAKEKGLAFLPGVEVTSKMNGAPVHILAYGLDLDNKSILEFLAANEKKMHEYNDSLIARLIDAGYDLDYAEYERYTWDRSRGGWKSLNFCIDKGLCHDVWSFFTELFVGELKIEFPDMNDLGDVIKTIEGAGGIPVWAHPGSLLVQGSIGWNKSLIEKMIDRGIQGLECYTSQHNPIQTNICLECATEYDLLITGGSDSHGEFAGRPLGLPKVYLYDLKLGPIRDRIQGV